MFLAAIVVAFWYLRAEEAEREQEALRRDVEYAQQRVRLRLLERQEQLMRIARDLSNQELERGDFVSRAEALISQYPELQAITWIDDRRRIRLGHGSLRFGGCGCRGCRPFHLALLHAEVETPQDRLEFLAGTADQRHHVGHDGEAAALDRALRTRLFGEALPPEHPVADEVRQSFEHVDAHDARPANAIAAYAIEAARRRAIEGSRGQALARRLGKSLDIELAVLEAKIDVDL